MRCQYICNGLMALFCILSPILAAASDGKDGADYQQYAIDQRDKPFDLACASKHGKYLQQAGMVTDGQYRLASISGGDSVMMSDSRASRDGYSRRYVSYETPNVELATEDNRTVHLAELLDTDRPVMLNFIFTTCTTICPVLSASFKQVQDLMGAEAQEVLMISITIDPEYDTPEKLAEYSKQFSAREQWKFLTGHIDDVIRVEKAFDIYRGSKVNHEPVTLMRSDRGSEWLRIEGFANAKEIVSEYRNLIAQGG